MKTIIKADIEDLGNIVTVRLWVNKQPRLYSTMKEGIVLL